MRPSEIICCEQNSQNTKQKRKTNNEKIKTVEKLSVFKTVGVITQGWFKEIIDSFVFHAEKLFK